MKRYIQLLVLCGFIGWLAACHYDEPVIFGIPDHIWSRMSYNQKNIVIKQATGDNSTSINPHVFAHCMAHCKPSPTTGAKGVDQVCFRQCLEKSTKYNYQTVEDIQDPADEWKH